MKIKLEISSRYSVAYLVWRIIYNIGLFEMIVGVFNNLSYTIHLR